MLDARPEIGHESALVWSAFTQLSAARRVGMAANPIAPSDVLAWLDIHCITDPGERVEFYELLLVMDQAWLRWHSRTKAN
ncbi:MAG: hypothetical protein VW405_01980 [Rhodospirillaceae bacterium]